MTQVTRTGRPERFNPASGKTITITVTMKVLSNRIFYEDQASRIAAQVRDLTRKWDSFTDPGQTTVEIDYSYPQWKRTYRPDGGQDQEGQK